MVVEKSQRLGGLIQTDVIEGCRLEAGPDSYIATKPGVTELAQEAGDLRNEIIGSNDQFRRIFIVRDGKLVAIPEGMVMMVPGKWGPLLRSGLFGLKAKARFVAETFSSARGRTTDISVEEFIADHFGREAVDCVTEPLLTSVYGGAPENLSAASVLPRFCEYEREYGSLIRGVRRERSRRTPGSSVFLSFRKGMQTLTDFLATASADWMDVVHSEVTQIRRGGNGWIVKTANEETRTDQLVLACPAHVSSQLLEVAEPDLARKLAEIPYSSAILVTLAYDGRKFKHALDGFGFLVPRIERRSLAAATWTSRKFPGRAPEGIALIRGFIVGSEAERLMQARERILLQEVSAEIERLMGVKGPPLFHKVHRWPKSMPQYVIGHGLRIREIREMVEDRPGLNLAGNAYDGVGVPDCVALAKQTAGRIVGVRSVMRVT